MKISLTPKKTIDIKVKKCQSFLSQAFGLMFRKNSLPLLFIFNKPKKISIHSFFCIPFIVIWFNKNRIVDVKLVKPWKLSIKPNSEFDKLLEIPSNNKYFKVFLDERKL